jgi:hypothetical protein
MGYFARERILRGCGPNLPSWTAVFAVDDFTEAECQTLAESVQHCLDELHDDGGHGPWHIELGPSAAEHPAAFVNLKSEWAARLAEIDSYKGSSHNSWQAEVYWLHCIASEHAEIIRGMRSSETPTVYLQCDGGHGYETFDCINDLTAAELETLETVLGQELYDMGLILKVVSDWHAEREPPIYVQARLSWNRFEEDLKNDEVDSTRMAASNVAYECIAEIKSLRTMPAIYGPANDRHDDAPRDDKTSTCVVAPVQELKADESLRRKYRDPDNYWRNVWLYELRKSGKTNAAIIAELSARAAEFAPLESENALRNAIETIAQYHQWPVLKGKAGRPRTADPE